MHSIKSVSLTGFDKAHSSSTLVLLKTIEGLANFGIRIKLLLSDLQLVKLTVSQLLTAGNFA